MFELVPIEKNHFFYNFLLFCLTNETKINNGRKTIKLTPREEDFLVEEELVVVLLEVVVEVVDDVVIDVVVVVDELITFGLTLNSLFAFNLK